MTIKILAGNLNGIDQTGNELAEGWKSSLVIKNQRRLFGGKTPIEFSEIAEIEEINDEF